MKNNQQRGQRKNRQNKGPSRRRGELVVSRSFDRQRDMVHRFSRTVNNTYSLTPSTGFNGSTNFDMEIDFTLANTQFYLGGALQANASNPGSSELIALFDEYRIDSVEVSLMLGCNSIQGGTAATAQLPILNIAFDPNDTSVTSLSSILQYQNLQIVQLGSNITQNGYVMKIRPTPLTTVGGVLSGTPSTRAPFISTDQPGVQHFGLKIFYDPAGSTLATVFGTLSIYVKYNLECKVSK